MDSAAGSPDSWLLHWQGEATLAATTVAPELLRDSFLASTEPVHEI